MRRLRSGCANAEVHAIRGTCSDIVGTASLGSERLVIRLHPAAAKILEVLERCYRRPARIVLDLIRQMHDGDATGSVIDGEQHVVTILPPCEHANGHLPQRMTRPDLARKFGDRLL